MVLQIVATGSSNGLQLVIGQRLAELSAGSCQRIVETVVGIVHLIDFEYGLQTTFIKAGIMSHKGQGSYLVSYVILVVSIVISHISNLLRRYKNSSVSLRYRGIFCVLLGELSPSLQCFYPSFFLYMLSFNISVMSSGFKSI